jgi:hypothetical protein
VDRREGDLALVSATPDNVEDVLCNSGATNHVTSHEEFFLSIRPTNICLRVVSQERLSVDGIGDATIPTDHGNLCLKNVLLCQQIGGTVLSVGFFDKWDGRVTFNHGAFTFHQGKNIFPTYTQHYQWFLSARPRSPSPVSPTCDLSSLSVSRLWHACMGHLAIQFLNRTIKHQCVLGVPAFHLLYPSSKCHSCLMSKSLHNPVNSPPCELVEKPGNMVAIDLVGPFAEALDGSLYAIVIHNFYSCMTSVAGLKSKADTPNEFIKWVETFESRTKYSVLGVRSDNAGELTSKKFNQFLESKKIHHEMSVPYEHHQNGAVEWTNRSLLDMARTSLLHAKLPQSLWMLALKHAAFFLTGSSTPAPLRLLMSFVLRRRPHWTWSVFLVVVPTYMTPITKNSLCSGRLL